MRRRLQIVTPTRHATTPSASIDTARDTHASTNVALTTPSSGNGVEQPHGADGTDSRPKLSPTGLIPTEIWRPPPPLELRAHVSLPTRCDAKSRLRDDHPGRGSIERPQSRPLQSPQDAEGAREVRGEVELAVEHCGLGEVADLFEDLEVAGDVDGHEGARVDVEYPDATRLPSRGAALSIRASCEKAMARSRILTSRRPMGKL